MSIQAKDRAQIGTRLVEVIEPYKVKGFWKTRIVSDPDPRRVGDIFIVTAGTIALFLVKEKSGQTHSNVQ